MSKQVLSQREYEYLEEMAIEESWGTSPGIVTLAKWEIDRLSERLAEIEAERDRYRDALKKYAKPANWGRPFICGTEQLSDYRTVFMVDGHGCDLARDALARTDTEDGE